MEVEKRRESIITSFCDSKRGRSVEYKEKNEGKQPVLRATNGLIEQLWLVDRGVPFARKKKKGKKKRERKKGEEKKELTHAHEFTIALYGGASNEILFLSLCLSFSLFSLIVSKPRICFSFLKNHYERNWRVFIFEETSTDRNPMEIDRRKTNKSKQNTKEFETKAISIEKIRENDSGVDV